MNSGKKSKLTTTSIINVILIISIIFNIIQYQRQSQYLSQMRVNNQLDMKAISFITENLANRLDQFIIYFEDEGEYDIHLSWKVVFGESIQIKSFLARLTPHYMGDLEEDWHDLQYILSRAEAPLYGYNFKFLERGSYSLSPEEIAELKAAAAVYRSISQGIERDPNSKSIKIHPGLIDSITEPMMTIDPYYAQFLEFRENRKR